MPTDLRDAVAEAIVSHEWDDFPRSAHNVHNYYGACAICQGDIPRIAKVALAALTERSGDLHGQVTEEIRVSLRQWDAMGIDGRPGVTLADFLAASVLALPAIAVAEARVGHAEAGAQLSSERLAKVQQELAEAKNLSGIRGKLLREAWDAHHATMDEQDALQRKLTAKEAEIVGLNRDRERWRTRAVEAEAKLIEVAKVRVWTNEDGKRFVFADDLTPILLPDMAAETTTTPARETA